MIFILMITLITLITLCITGVISLSTGFQLFNKLGRENIKFHTLKLAKKLYLNLSRLFHYKNPNLPLCRFYGNWGNCVGSENGSEGSEYSRRVLEMLGRTQGPVVSVSLFLYICIY